MDLGGDTVTIKVVTFVRSRVKREVIRNGVTKLNVSQSFCSSNRSGSVVCVK
jgi:hypothetical protein